jgi:phage shock protein PspC (stress-responsive transcriptional regulator)
MSNDSAQPQPGSGDRPAPAEPIRRSRTDRRVAGVCGGLGRHFNVDPVVFRIVLGVLAVFGGMGVLLYGLGWLLLPEEGDEPLLRRVGSGRIDSGTAVAVVTTVIGGIVFFSYLEGGFGSSFPLLMVAALVLFLAWTDNRRRQPAAVPRTAATAAVDDPADPTSPTTAWWREGASETGWKPWSAADTREVVDKATASAASAVDEAAKTYETAYGKAYEASYTRAYDKAWQPPGDSAKRTDPSGDRPNRYVATAVFSLAVVVGGILWGIDALDLAEIGWKAGIAAVIGVLGLGLVAGSLFGRTRGLILPAALLTYLLIAVTSWNVPLEGPSGERDIRPTAVSEVRDPIRMTAGQLDLNLRDLPLDPAKPVRVEASVVMGQIRLNLPADARIVFTGHTKYGDLVLPDGRDSGISQGRDAVLEPLRLPSRGTIEVDLKVGAGEIKVTRDA